MKSSPHLLFNTAGRLLLAVASAVIAVTAQAQVAASYRVIELDSVSTGVMYSSATDINNMSQICGYVAGGGIGSIEFLWDTSLGLQHLQLPAGNAAAHGINDSGHVVGFFTEYSSNPRSRAFVWSPVSGYHDIGGSGTRAAIATAINNSGTAVGLAEFPINGGYAFRPFVWDATNGTKSIGTLGGLTGQAWAINGLGQVAGFADTGTAQHAFFWKPSTGMIDLGGPSSAAYGLNDLGQVVGLHWISGSQQAFVWSESSGLQLIDRLPTTSVNTDDVAFAINNSGTVVGRSGEQAFVWSSSTGTVDLNTRLEPGSAGWHLYEARAINDAGVIVGQGITPNGDQRAFLAVPGTSAPSVQIESARMTDWHTLTVRVRGTWPGTPGKYRLEAVINGAPVTVDQGEEKEPEFEDIQIVLDEEGVPKFETDQSFVVTVVPMDGSRQGTSDDIRVSVPLPVLVLQGIFTDGGFGGLDPYLTDAARPFRYSKDGAYRDLFAFTLGGYGYDPDSQTLSKSAELLKAAVLESAAHAGLRLDYWNYARKVDLVCHSKGGLVARQFLKDNPQYAGAIRKLIMACTPHTGSAAAYVPSLTPDPSAKKAYRELLPTQPWWRRSIFETFKEIYGGNKTLKSLNATPIPFTIEVYLLYGDGLTPTPVNFTADYNAFGFMPGDGAVVPWSAQGYDVTNNVLGLPSQGALILALQAANIREVSALPYRHDSFLRHASDTVYSMLRSPSPTLP